jgi:hypothetical protein
MTEPSDLATRFTSLQELQEAIARGKGEDPWIGPRMGSGVALDHLLNLLRGEQGIQAETLMGVIGFLIGQGVQASLHDLRGLHLVSCRNGLSYLFGDPLNQRLIKGLDSPWELLSEASRQEGWEDLPVPEILLLEGIQRLGSTSLADPRLPGHEASGGLDTGPWFSAWQLVDPLCRAFCADPDEWGLFYGLLGVRALRLVKSCLSPAIAFRLAMATAIDASKIPMIGSESAAEAVTAGGTTEGEA